jgi:Icc protein
MIATSSIKILQLSDFHLFAKKERQLAGVQTFATLTAIIEKVKQNLNLFTPDFIAITGDISQDNTLESYKHARNFLKDLPYPMTAIPGNHENIDHFFSSFIQSMQTAKKITLGNWQLLFLNSHWPGKVAGLLSQSELDFLSDALRNSGDKFTIIFVHHHILPVGCQWLDNLNLSNSNEFLKIIRPHKNIKAIVSGHVHQEHTQIKNDFHFITTPSTCFQFAKNSAQFKLDTVMPGFRYFNLYENGSFATEVVRVHRNKQFMPDLKVESY